MGSCAAPSAKGDDKFITTDYLQQCPPDSIEILASGRCRDHVVYQWDEDQRNAAADSWNACRAAMLEADPQLPGSDSAPRAG
ncbi:hypothetical protein CJ430_28085 [Klebsiella pneumoniae]|nr:hypothetical protein CJ430_28085 [Klebsiella pneumoniae]